MIISYIETIFDFPRKVIALTNILIDT